MSVWKLVATDGYALHPLDLHTRGMSQNTFSLTYSYSHSFNEEQPNIPVVVNHWHIPLMVSIWKILQQWALSTVHFFNFFNSEP
jgi:hypothetical protein